MGAGKPYMLSEKLIYLFFIYRELIFFRLFPLVWLVILRLMDRKSGSIEGVSLCEYLHYH